MKCPPERHGGRRLDEEAEVIPGPNYAQPNRVAGRPGVLRPRHVHPHVLYASVRAGKEKPFVPV